MKNRNLLVYSSVMLTLCISICNNAQAGGIALGATRVIYPQEDKQVSLAVTNSSESSVYLIQNWVSSSGGEKTADFVITPPLFVIEPQKENTLRIMYAGPKLPTDRETVYYINSKAIPSVDKNKLKGNSLQIATQSVIKLFVRPKNLPTSPLDAPKTLTCQFAAGGLNINNPSPYYVSLVDFYVGDKKIPNTMVSPKGKMNINVNVRGAVKFRTMNDFGAMTASQSCLE